MAVATPVFYYSVSRKYCRGYLRPHGLVVTSGASVSAIDRNSTRDVRQSCQQIFLPVAAVYVSA
ncbi:hypothetical protein OUZ56_033605 [Daphnia magna]|uniref:Uncharacterized protein n=1 Tax=Daphnia magna TaxID=35525 RepID=A0ABR0BAX4_9CRUS|nr:hypothetical protein OUZ56_033935 [Daphnia magna]KAK4045723.1 hypothetical protein OUZ56_033605 [Daphnia magna]